MLKSLSDRVHVLEAVGRRRTTHPESHGEARVAEPLRARVRISSSAQISVAARPS
jgi:hypothetical protein